MQKEIIVNTSSFVNNSIYVSKYSLVNNIVNISSLFCFVSVLFVCCLERACSIFGCECVQCLRGGVRFPNEVGVWWPSVYGGPNPKALHFQPWVGLGFQIGRHCTTLTGAWPFALNTKKKTLGRCMRYLRLKNSFFTGVPFLILRRKVFNCQHGLDRTAAEKRKRKDAEEVLYIIFSFYP